MNATAQARRFSAPTVREALKRATAALGPDALILSSRKVSGGVEVFAAAAQFLERIGQPASAPVAEPAAGRAALDTERAAVEQLRALSTRIAGQIERLAWSEEARRRPLRTQIAGRLLNAGFSSALARQITETLPDDYGAAQAERWIRATLQQNLKCMPESGDIVARGGVYALVGPTGVGKTTTAAKLAARCVVRYGADALGLVTTDSYRVGAFDQLRIYGRILGVPVRAANDATELDEALAALRTKRLVLIDTVGIGQRDARMVEHLALLARPTLARVLVLSAAAQGETIEDALLAYRAAAPACIIGTKLDEAVKLGGILDAAIRHRMTFAAVANGQRVPEDLHPANPLYLVDRALRVPSRGPFGVEGEAQLALLAGAGEPQPAAGSARA